MKVPAGIDVEAAIAASWNNLLKCQWPEREKVVVHQYDVCRRFSREDEARRRRLKNRNGKGREARPVGRGERGVDSAGREGREVLRRGRKRRNLKLKEGLKKGDAEEEKVCQNGQQVQRRYLGYITS